MSMNYESSLDRDPGARYRRNTITGEIERVDIDGVAGDPLMTPTGEKASPASGEPGRNDKLTAGVDQISMMVAKATGKPLPKTRLQRLADWTVRTISRGWKSERAARRREAAEKAGRPNQSRRAKESRRAVQTGRKVATSKASPAGRSRRLTHRGR